MARLILTNTKLMQKFICKWYIFWAKVIGLRGYHSIGGHTVRFWKGRLELLKMEDKSK